MPAAYTWFLLAGVALSAWIWIRRARQDSRLPVLYLAALLGALVGAKLVYLLAEGWRDWGQPDRWGRLASGKTVLGGLLLGYPAVEWAKRILHYPRPTGDRFALVVPLSLAIGRVGCLAQGCCLGRTCPVSWYTVEDARGIARWPAVPVELGFNLTALAVLGLLHLVDRQRGQRFHLFLVGYGVFRFLHEFVRDTPRIPHLGPFSGYHLAALALAALGLSGYARRARADQQPREATSAVRS